MASPVLLCTDGSALSIVALRAGVDLLGPSTTYAVVTVMDEPDPMWVTGTGMAGSVMTTEEFQAESNASEVAADEVVAATQQALGLAGSESHVLRGAPGEAICDLAASLEARALVVLGHVWAGWAEAGDVGVRVGPPGAPRAVPGRRHR